MNRKFCPYFFNKDTFFVLKMKNVFTLSSDVEWFILKKIGQNQFFIYAIYYARCVGTPPPPPSPPFKLSKTLIRLMWPEFRMGVTAGGGRRGEPPVLR